MFKSRSSNISRNFLSYLCVPAKSPAIDIAQINVRVAVCPSSQTYTAAGDPTLQSSCLAGDPKIIGVRQEIQDEVLTRWSQRPTLNACKEWVKNVIYC